MTNSNEPRSVRPPESVFIQKPIDIVDKVLAPEGSPLHVFTGKVTVPPEGGMNLHFKDMLYPKKGFPFMEAAQANNIVKRQTMMVMSSLGQKEIALAGFGFMLTSYKKKIKMLNRFLEMYCRSADYVFEQFYLQNRFMTPCTQQIKTFLENFLARIGIREDIANRSALIMATMVEWDDAYRYRIEDLASESSQSALYADPAKEINRIIGILAEREIVHGENLVNKFKSFTRILTLLLMWHPRVKVAFRRAIMTVDFKHLQLDEADRYHCLLRDDYQFMGRPIADRIAEFESLHKGHYPPALKYEK